MTAVGLRTDGVNNRRRTLAGLAALALGLAALALSFGATSAQAVVAKIGGHGYGITPIGSAEEAGLVSAYRAQHAAARGGSGARNFDEPPFGGTPLKSEGGPVMHSATTHVIYWDPPTSQFTATTKNVVENFFTHVAHDSGLPSNVFAITGQYTDSSGNAAYSSTFAGALVDSEKYPTSGNCTVPKEVDAGPPYTTCLFDKQLQEELSAFIAEEGLPTGPTQLYFVLLPHNVATCLPELFEGKQVCSNNFYCAYHSYISPGTANEIIYADIPFSLLDTTFAKGCQDDGHEANLQLPNGDSTGTNASTRFADVALKYISHEYIEAVTDPLVNEFTAWVDREGLEIGDKCNGVSPDPAEDGIGYDKNAFLPTLGGTVGGDNLFNQSIDTGSYYLQSEWDNAGKACLMKPLALSGAQFTQSQASTTVGSPVSFEGGVSDPYGAAGFAWDFGDGATGVGSSPSHTYTAPGVYTVTMTPKDALTDSTATPVSHTVVVSAPPVVPPKPVPPNSGFSPVGAASVNARTGAVTFHFSVADPGTFSWVLTFSNGKFGVFAARNGHCRTGQVKLNGKCRPASIVFARGSQTVSSPGTVTFTVKPTASGMKALRNALKKKKGLPVTATVTFQSAHGGSPVSHAQSLTVKLKKK